MKTFYTLKLVLKTYRTSDRSDLDLELINFVSITQTLVQTPFMCVAKTNNRGTNPHVSASHENIDGNVGSNAVRAVLTLDETC